MAEIKPLRAVRYTHKAGDISSLVCPPYDIVSDGERAELLAKNPYNLIKIELPRGEEPYKNAAETLDGWKKDGVLERDASPSYFIYQMEFSLAGATRTLTGLVCRVKLTDFSEGIVLPHEETLSKAKADRFALMSSTFCNFSSVYSLYDGDKATQSAVEASLAEKELYRFTDGDGVTHSLRRITSDSALSSITNAFAGKKLFIADGHHRYETACNFKKKLIEDGVYEDGEGYVLMTLVDLANSGLAVLPTHRLITGMAVDKAALMQKCADNFTFTEYDDISSAETVLADRADRHVFALYTGGSGFTLIEAKKHVDSIRYEGRSQAYASLDVTVLHELILSRAMGIDKANMAQQINLRYTRSAEEAVVRVTRGESACAFILNPTKITQIRDVALAGDKMPQKSTYFYPKLTSGLVINELKG